MTEYVAYYRVSTDAQGRSGLGLEAQQEAIRRFVRNGDYVIGEFTEIESGSVNDRPQLTLALALCRRKRARLLIAKLDRLSRNMHFISGLMESDVKFTAVDMPDADPFRLHIEAAVAEEERRKIRVRIREALAAAKRRGVKLGGAREGAPPPTAEASRRGADRVKANAQRHADDIARVIATWSGTAGEIARELNSRGILTPRGKLWTRVQVSRVLKRVSQEGVHRRTP